MDKQETCHDRRISLYEQQDDYHDLETEHLSTVKWSKMCRVSLVSLSRNRWCAVRRSVRDSAWLSGLYGSPRSNKQLNWTRWKTINHLDARHRLILNGQLSPSLSLFNLSRRLLSVTNTLESVTFIKSPAPGRRCRSNAIGLLHGQLFKDFLYRSPAP